MPGTCARRAREDRAQTLSLEFITQRPTATNGVELRLVKRGDRRPSSWRLSPSGQRDRHRHRRRSQSPGFTLHVLPFTVSAAGQAPPQTAEPVPLMAMHVLRQKLLNPCAHLVEPLAGLEIRKEIGQVAPHSLAVPIHHG